MTRSESRSSLAGMVSQLGWPLLLGAGLCGIFLALLYQGPLHTPLMMRYFAGHPINLCTTVLFFVGLAALIFKFADVRLQFSALSQVELPPAPVGGQPLSQVSGLLDALASLPSWVQDSYLGKRLTELLESVERKGTAAGLDDEIKYLADMDAARQQDSYALVRIVIWAAPMLGFLGTVVGITDALGDLGQQFAQNQDTNLGDAMNGLLSGLYVAFDTTAQALLLSMVLMFIQFLCDRLESQVLSAVDRIVGEEMVGRFQDLGTSNDPHLASIERMSASVLATTEALVERQAQVWRKSLEASEKQWSQVLAQAGHDLQTALTAALEQSLKSHADMLAKNEAASSAQQSRQIEKWQAALLENAKLMQAQQQELIKQGALLTQAVQATGEVTRLEQALNANLVTLAGAKNFEETVISLAAAVQLLSSRLGRTDAPRVELNDGKVKGRAA